MRHTSYKYRLYPTDEQAKWFDSSFAAIRWVYNAALYQRETYGRAQGTDPFGRDSVFNYIKQTKDIAYRDIAARNHSGLSKDEELSWITNSPAECLGAALRDLDKAFDKFFKGTGGYPTDRTMAKNNSMSFKAWARGRVDGKVVSKPVVIFGHNSVTIPKIGRVKYVRHKKFYGDPKTIAVIKEVDQYFIILTTAHPIAPKTHKGGSVGVDIGVKRPVCLSNGEHTIPDDGIKPLYAKLDKAHKSLSRKQRGAKRRHKQRQHLVKIYRKIARRRKAMSHRVTTEMTRRFKYIAIEDLKVKEMTQSAKGTVENPGKLVKVKAKKNRAILNVAPYMIRSQLIYKAERMGVELALVDPKHTSQICNQCGHRDEANRQSQSKFICTKCGHTTNADVNAARNILMRANPSAGVVARRKSPSDSSSGTATIKANGSCFQSATLHNCQDPASICVPVRGSP